jgi:hypothetical protein
MLGLTGALLVFAGGMSPMLRPIIGSWNYWDIDTTLATIAFTLAAIGLLAAISNKKGLLRFAGWAELIFVTFTLVAVYFKVNDYFSFLPFKKLAAAASGLIHYRWMGWALLYAGSLLMIIGSKRSKVVKPSPQAVR